MNQPPRKLSNYAFVKFFFLFSFLCLAYSPIIGQSSAIDTIPTIFKELQRPDLLQITLATNTKQLVKTKYKEEWQLLEMTVQDTAGGSITYKAKVRTRGNIRKKVCYYPPLKLKFKKNWLQEQGMDSTFNDLKLVVGCKKGGLYTNLVLKEYLAYQLYAAFTDWSFKTQLAEIEMIDTEGAWDPIKTYGFIIENDEELAARFDGRCTKPRVMRSKSIGGEQLAKLVLFEYMIGNTDWATPNSHNIRFLRTRTYPKVIPVAYDFDYSGLVDAPYAVHRESLNIDEITQRHFLGPCTLEKKYADLIPLFLEKKDTFYQIINDFELLSKKERKKMTVYLDEFYKILDNPKRFKRAIVDACVKK